MGKSTWWRSICSEGKQDVEVPYFTGNVTKVSSTAMAKILFVGFCLAHETESLDPEQDLTH